MITTFVVFSNVFLTSFVSVSFNLSHPHFIFFFIFGPHLLFFLAGALWIMVVEYNIFLETIIKIVNGR
jgi:hypothetical protein